jgi:hypothetical protein
VAVHIYTQTIHRTTQIIILNVHGVNDVRPTEIHTTEPLIPEPSVSDVDMDIEKTNKQNKTQITRH